MAGVGVAVCASRGSWGCCWPGCCSARAGIRRPRPRGRHRTHRARRPPPGSRLRVSRARPHPAGASPSPPARYRGRRPGCCTSATRWRWRPRRSSGRSYAGTSRRSTPVPRTPAPRSATTWRARPTGPSYRPPTRPPRWCAGCGPTSWCCSSGGTPGDTRRAWTASPTTSPRPGTSPGTPPTRAGSPSRSPRPGAATARGSSGCPRARTRPPPTGSGASTPSTRSRPPPRATWCRTPGRR